MKNKFYRKVLKNGMTILLEKRDLPIVSVAIAVRNGGINEVAEEKGISHFIEHLLYKGTKKRNAKQIAEEIEKNGGDLNGFTEENITAFWCKMPSDKLNIALNVLSDMVKNPRFEKKELEKERKVIFEEIKLYHDSPQAHILHDLNTVLFEPPFGIPLIGTKETLSKMNREEIIKKFKKVYTPNNLILCVVGNCNFEKLVSFAERNFGDQKNDVPQLEIKKKNEIRIEKRKGIDQANLVFAFHSPLSTEKNSYVSSVLMTALAGGMSSRLFTEIREKRNLAYAVKGECASTKKFGYSLIYVGTTKENVKKVKELIIKELKKISKKFPKKEFNDVKKQIIGNYKISMEDSQEQMTNLLGFELDGNAEEYYQIEKKVKVVKISDVKKLAKSASDKFSFFALVPEE